MTSDTAQQETKPQAKPPETFRSHMPAIIAAMTGTVLAAVLGSLLGSTGTIVGMALGSMASGTCSWWAERGIRRSAAAAQARAEALRARGHHTHPGQDAAATRTAVTRLSATEAAAAQTAAYWSEPPGAETSRAGTTRAEPTRAAARRHGRTSKRPRWALPVMFVVAAFVGCALVVTAVEGAAGKPLSAVVQDKPGHGTTLGGGSVGKSAATTPTPTPSVSVTGGTTAPATTSPSAGASGTPSASVSPSATTQPTVSTSPSVTPTATPTGTSTDG